MALEHPTSSRRHAALTTRAGGIELTDLGPRNVTLVGGRPVTSACPIGPDDVIRLGALAVEVRRGPAPLPRRSPPTASGSSELSARPFNRPPRSGTTLEQTALERPMSETRPPRAGAGLSVTMLLGPLVFGAVLAVLFSPLMAIFALMGRP